MEALSIIISIIGLIFGVLQIILFFKVWGMCNDVNTLCNHFVQSKKNEAIPTVQNTPNKTTDLSWLWVVAILAMMILLIVLLQ